MVCMSRGTSFMWRSTTRTSQPGMGHPVIARRRSRSALARVRHRAFLARRGGHGTGLGEAVARFDVAMERRSRRVHQLGRRRRAAQHDRSAGWRHRSCPRSGQFNSMFAMVGTIDMLVARSCSINRSTCAGRTGGPSPGARPCMVQACGRPQPLAWNRGMVCSSTPLSSLQKMLATYKVCR